MSYGEPVAPNADTSTTRLVGWKEISAYLRRSIRTVQRWEHESDLPVRRYPTKRGEGVFALREELDAWLKSASGTAAAEGLVNGSSDDSGKKDGDGHDDATRPASRGNQPLTGPAEATTPAPVRRGFVPGRVTLAALTIVVFATFLAHVWLVPACSRQQPQPATVKVVGEDIIAFDAAGTQLWKYALDHGARVAAGPDQVIVDDVDGDGRSEVIVSLASEQVESDAVLCLDASGTKRWSRAPQRRAQFGHGPMGAPWVPLFVKTTGAPGRRLLWVSWANSPFFGAFVERLDVGTGEPKAVYWSAGYVTSLAATEVAGRPVLLVGAANNEHRAASVAVYDLSVTAGSAPAINPTYRCQDCPSGRPLAFFVFPKTALSRAATAETAPLGVSSINVTETGFVIAVEHTPGGITQAPALYRFDRNLHIVGAETIDSYRVVHHDLERQGRLTAPHSDVEERQLFPVLSWDGTKYVELTAPTK
ncbi:MAG: hypothetical protein ACM3NQ_01835 [Bacteroidales bacterium]